MRLNQQMAVRGTWFNPLFVCDPSCVLIACEEFCAEIAEHVAAGVDGYMLCALANDVMDDTHFVAVHG